MGTFFLLVYPAINGFPLLYSDTATYIVSGFGLDMPFDRPMTYGLFLVASSLGGLTFLLTVFFQSLILSWLLLRIIERFAGKQKGWVMALVYFILAVPAGLSWYSGQLMPDFFTPVSVLSALLILHPSTRKSELTFLLFLFILASSVHLSHFSFNLVMLVFLYIMSRLRFVKLSRLMNPLRIWLLVAGSALSFLTMMVPMSKSSHIFLMGAMVENGILKTFLDDNCPEHHYALCEYRDSLPDKAWQFIWMEKKSPLYKVGGWNGTKREFNEIILKTLTTPKYIKMHIECSLKNTPVQLATFKMGDGNGPFGKGTMVYRRIEDNSWFDIIAERRALQQKSDLYFLPFMNRVLAWLVILSLAGIILLISVYRKRLTVQSFYFTVVISGAVIINAWIAATFGGITDRLEGKMIWLVVFALLILILQPPLQSFTRMKNPG